MQHCDSTCSWCAREFWDWWKGRLRAQDRQHGRSGAGSFNQAAVTSIRASEKASERDADARALASGEKSVEQLRGENGAFAFPRRLIRLDMSRTKH